MTTNETGIHTRALLVWLTISTWSARRYDKNATRQTLNANGATGDAGRFNKLLLPGDAPSYKTLVTLSQNLRAWHYSQTLSWSDEGWRLLPTANFQAYTDELRDKLNAIDNAADEFVRDYPTLKTQAERMLGKLYNAEDYPERIDMKGKFKSTVTYMPVPASNDIRVDLGADQIAAIRESVETSIGAATEIAMRDCWTRLHDVVSHAVERLSDPKAIFRDTLIDNAREICDSLKRLNVTNDPKLEDMRARVARELASVDPDTLRVNKIVRAKTADRVRAIESAMRGVYGAA